MNILLKSYAIRHDSKTETLFYEENGDFYTTGPIEYSAAFAHGLRRWTKIDALPNEAEFIGNYPKNGVG